MTKLLEEALAHVRALPPAAQDAIAQTMLAFARGDKGAPEDIDPGHLPDVLKALAEAERREFSNAAEVDAAFGLFG